MNKIVNTNFQTERRLYARQKNFQAYLHQTLHRLA